MAFPKPTSEPSIQALTTECDCLIARKSRVGFFAADHCTERYSLRTSLFGNDFVERYITRTLLSPRHLTVVFRGARLRASATRLGLVLAITEWQAPCPSP